MTLGPTFLETICAVDHTYPLLAYHQQRLAQTYRHFFGGTPPQLTDHLPEPAKSKHKVRVHYGADHLDVTSTPYTNRQIQQIKTITATPSLTYTYKYAHREDLESLFAQRGNADEILIIKNQLLTDSFYANIALWDGSHWYTPAHCLLNGVRRQALLEAGRIISCPLSVSDLTSFQKISFISGMLELDEVSAPVSAIS
ncbi:aminotransferase class IV [Marinoscillum furvescens]|uniref:4-amino-4-deoxychorismate lyase n=1 Tax=Marinoscillum furvescens DSM 4134 TaxID=1122208 RepID=A0A3D9LL13_MARFU|nr:aminotransferase class IV [Marinoscillum furvescens]REE05952.1 4-amino-4-deoxychorismate lyase [Marinoscillum furvescens DSM 4134]